MIQDNLRQQVYFMKRLVSYQQMAKNIGLASSSFYSWLDGNYNLAEDKVDKLQRYITTILLDKTEGNKKYKTVRNLIALLSEYHFDDDEILIEIPKYYDINERYYITNKSTVFSLCNNSWIIRKPQIDKDGYKYIDLYCNGERKRKRISQLVVEAFMPYVELESMEVHHIDGDRQNDHLDNLIPLTKEQHIMIHKYLNKWNKGDNI